MSDEGEFRKVRRDRIFEKDYFDKKYGALPEVSDGFDLIEAMKGQGRSLPLFRHPREGGDPLAVRGRVGLSWHKIAASRRNFSA